MPKSSSESKKDGIDFYKKEIEAKKDANKFNTNEIEQENPEKKLKFSEEELSENKKDNNFENTNKLENKNTQIFKQPSIPINLSKNIFSNSGIKKKKITSDFLIKKLNEEPKKDKILSQDTRIPPKDKKISNSNHFQADLTYLDSGEWLDFASGAFHFKNCRMIFVRSGIPTVMLNLPAERGIFKKENEFVEFKVKERIFRAVIKEDDEFMKVLKDGSDEKDDNNKNDNVNDKKNDDINSSNHINTSNHINSSNNTVTQLNSSETSETVDSSDSISTDSYCIENRDSTSTISILHFSKNDSSTSFESENDNLTDISEIE